MTGWESFVRRLIDEPGAHVAVTGSSARMLSREIATSLRGRSLATEVLPFGYDEVLAWHGVPLPERWPPDAATRALLEHHLRGYLQRGGFPEVQGLTEDLRVRVLQDDVQVVLLRDVAERHGVTNTVALRALVRRLIAAPGGRFSVHRLYHDLRSQGIAVSKDLLHALVGHLEDAFLIATVPIATASESTRNAHPRTCYLADPGLATASAWRASPDWGHLLENAVYLELRRRSCTVSYVVTAAGTEVDFLATPLTGPSALIQVCADLSDPETRARELRALQAAMVERGHAASWIVTLEEEDTISLPEGTVHVVPAWRWLLDRPEGCA